MKKLLVFLLLCLGFSASAHSQSTTVSGTVTDTGAQTWNSGTYSFQFVPNPNFPNIAQYTWTGGTLPQTVSGPLDASGFYTTSVPSNSAISPQGSKWVLSVCPLATWPCFNSANTTITGATQTLNVTPSAIAINLTSPPGSYTRAYADAEIASAVIGAQYYNVTNQVVRVCQVVVVQTCTVWANVGSPGGSDVSPAPQFASAYYNTSTTIGGIPASPPTVNGSYLCGYDISGSIASAPSCDQTGLSARAVTGATATDTILYTDNNSTVEYEGSVAVAVSLPTPTTLTNPFFYTVLDNLTTGVSTSVTVTPVTFTINGAATLVITQNQRCLIQVDPALATNWLASCTGGGAAAFPRLDQVLDPTVDKTFVMGAHKLIFDFNAATADSDPLFVIPNEPDFGQGNSVVHIGPAASLFFPYSLEGFNNFETGSLQGTAFEAQTQQSDLSALGVATAEILINATRSGGTGVAVEVFEATSGANDIANIFGIDITSAHSSSGILNNLYGLRFQTPQITAGGTVTNAFGVKIEDQNIATNNWAIKTGLGLVQFGDAIIGSTTGDSGNANLLSCETSTNTGGGVNCLTITAHAPSGGGGARGLIVNAANTEASGDSFGAGIFSVTSGAKNSTALTLSATSDTGDTVALELSAGSLTLAGLPGTLGQVLTSAGLGLTPTWTTPSTPNVFSATQTGQVAAITDTTMVTVGGTTALYRFTGTINCTTTSAAATATLNLKYTDSASTVQTVSVTDTCTALVTSGIPNLVVGLRAKNATAITYGVTIANTPTYDVDVRLEKM